MSSFSVQNKKLHLRWSNHLDKKLLLEKLRENLETDERKIIGYSFVWDHTPGENSDSDDYKHTHGYIETSKEMRFRNTKPFTVDGIKPRVTKVLDKEHRENVLLYHDKKGEEVYTNIDRSGIGKMVKTEDTKVKSIRSKTMKDIRDRVYKCTTEKEVLDVFEEESIAGDLGCLISMWKTKPAPPKPEGPDISWWYDWKKDLLNEIQNEPPHERKIDVYVNTLGCAGKTDFVDYTVDYIEGVVRIEPISMYHLATVLLEYTRSGQKIKTILIDINKDAVLNSDFYSTLESLKNGKFISQKFKGTEVKFDRPRIVIFTNRMLHLWRLSPDRWDVKFIGNDNKIFHRITSADLVRGHVEADEEEMIFVKKLIESLKIKNLKFLKIKE